jgi:hypothetical protein
MAKRRKCRRMFSADKSVADAVDCVLRTFGSSAHSLIQSVGIEPDDVLLQLCVHVYQHLSRWGIITDLLLPDEPVTHCIPAAQSHCTSDHKSKSIPVTHVPDTLPDDLISLTSDISSSSSISLLEDPKSDPILQNNFYSSAFTDFSGMSDSKYGAVDFRNIREQYVPDADIVCRFEYTQCEYQPGDVIGIKKIGWKMDEMHTSLVSVSASDAVIEADTPAARTMRITFPRSLFAGLTAWPDDDLFQFCYISGSVLQGASAPFNIIRPKESDYGDFSRDSDSNDDDGFVVLRSPQALLQEKMEKLQTDLTAAESEKAVFEIKNKVLNEALDQLNVKYGNVEVEKVSVQEERDALTAELDALRTSYKRLEQTLSDATSSHRTVVTDMTASLTNEKKRNEGLMLALQETSDELTRVRAENAELRKSLNDWTRRRQADEQVNESNDMMIRVLKEEVRQLEQKTSLANAERDFAISSLDAAKKSLVQMAEQRNQNDLMVAELRRSVDQSNSVVSEYKLRLDKAKVEYEEKYKLCIKLEGKLQRLREKVSVSLFYHLCSNH